MAIAFYCLGTLDVTSLAQRQISPTDRESWKEWIWDQYVGKLVYTPVYVLSGGLNFVCCSSSSCACACTCAVHMVIEGGFHPGPLVKVSGGGDDMTAAHVRLISLHPFPPCAPLAHTSGSTSTIITMSFADQQTMLPPHTSRKNSTFACGQG
jgi:hypothetical protein